MHNLLERIVGNAEIMNDKYDHLLEQIEKLKVDNEKLKVDGEEKIHVIQIEDGLFPT